MWGGISARPGAEPSTDSCHYNTIQTGCRNAADTMSNVQPHQPCAEGPITHRPDPSPDRNPAKSTLFRHQFRLPDSQSPLEEITAELTISPPISYSPTATQGEKDRDRDRGYHYVGKLHLSQSYLCFSTQPTSFLQTASTSTSSAFTGQTHGAGPGGNGFTLPLCAIRRVERLHSQSYQVWGMPGAGISANIVSLP